MKSFYSTLELEGEVSFPSKLVWILRLLLEWVFFFCMGGLKKGWFVMGYFRMSEDVEELVDHFLTH